MTSVGEPLRCPLVHCHRGLGLNSLARSDHMIRTVTFSELKSTDHRDFRIKGKIQKNP